MGANAMDVIRIVRFIDTIVFIYKSIYPPPSNAMLCSLHSSYRECGDYNSCAWKWNAFSVCILFFLHFL